MSSASAVSEIAVGRFMRCYSGKSRACGARRFFFIAYPGLTAWAKLWRASGASERGEAGEEAGEAWRGHGCPVPLQRQDAAFGLGALKRRPYIYSKSGEAGEARRGHGCAVPLQRKDPAVGLLRPGMPQKSGGLRG